MGNTIDDLMPKILARALMVLREQSVMPRLVNGDYGTDPSKKGSVIDVPVPVAVTTLDVVPGTVPIATVDVDPANVQISLDNWKQNHPIALTDKDLNQIDAKDNFLPMTLQEAVRALSNDVNDSIFACYKGSARGVYGCSYTGFGTDPFGTNDGNAGATRARKVLNQQLCPIDNRRAVLNVDADANAIGLAAFSDAEKMMSAAVKMSGELGHVYGMDFAWDNSVPDHVAGTMATQVGTYTITNAILGATALTVTSNSSSDDDRTILQGDIVSFSGSSAGVDSQTYTITADTLLEGGSGSQTATLAIYPGLKVAHEGAATVMDVKASHPVNLAFHRDAFAFANRPLKDALIADLGVKSMTLQDSVTGLVLRLQITRQHMQTVWEFDILWGCDLVRPEMACRIIGDAG